MAEKTYNIHFITNYQDSRTETIAKRKKYLQSNDKWGNIEVNEDKPADFWIIQNHPGSNRNWIPEKTLLFYNEPILSRRRWVNWANQHRFLCNYTERNFFGWGISKSYTELTTEPIFKFDDKKNSISAIISDLNIYPGHKIRLDFLKYMDTLSDKELNVDIYGKKNYNPSPLDNLKNYRGPIPGTKDPGLLPYQYHMAAENSKEIGYLTEKLLDPILSESLCFYSGCPNVRSYIHNKAFVEIDLNRPDYSIKLIEKYMKADAYYKHLKYIKYAKHKILNELSIMPVIHKIINEKVG